MTLTFAAQMRVFREALDRGNVVDAIMLAPFGYTSRALPNGFRFRIESGPLAGNVGEDPSLIGAVRKAVDPAGRVVEAES